LLTLCGKTSKKPIGCGKLKNIYGGTDARSHSWPWMAVILNEDADKVECGGFLISPKTIITAAHCVNSENSIDFLVGLGVHDIENIQENDLYNIYKIIIHRDFNVINADNDIAIIVLKDSADFSDNIQPICLPSKDIDEIKKCYSSGWGSTYRNSGQSRYIKQVCLPLIPWKDCKDIYGNDLTKNMICAGDIKRGVIDTCEGDSDGPLMCYTNKWEVYGITSWGYGCGEPNNPGVFTDINRFIDWIEENKV
ncbi:trypsin-like, partial [Gordionus sp. m RMFG-2023]|uniref:trypsin-like n=1 Tax=Gordionus sp. m RMFG-2023 TaxID=3053472 RepID=UPI0031FBF3FC